MKYLSPTCRSIRIETEPSFAASAVDVSEMKGLTEDNPEQLHQMLPCISFYDELEPDIQAKLKMDPEEEFAANYRIANIDGIDYIILIRTQKIEEDHYLCYYLRAKAHTPEVKDMYLHFNLRLVIESDLRQIRFKTDDGHYEYNLSPEVRQKMPTFCKLLSNAEENRKNPQYGRPEIVFLDKERRDPLLTVRFEASKAEEFLATVNESFYKIIVQLEKEMDEAGFLVQSRKRLIKGVLRIALLARHFF